MLKLIYGNSQGTQSPFLHTHVSKFGTSSQRHGWISFVMHLSTIPASFFQVLTKIRVNSFRELKFLTLNLMP